jgi:uncharacterized protein involved in exopolysaccharide biosynthesis
MRELPSGIPNDTVELGEVIRTVRLGWRSVLSWLAIGLVSALAIIVFVPAQFKGRASVLVRTASESGSSLLSKVTGLDLPSGDIGGGLKSPLETEIQLLKSRSLIGHVMDSLRLQVRVRTPRGVPAAAVVEHTELSGAFAPSTYRFVRTDENRYRVSGGDSEVVAVGGEPLRLAEGSITLRRTGLPDRFTLKLYDREDAIARFQKRLDVGKAGGDVAKIAYDADDSLTAASATNALVDLYLAQRKTVDRGVNQRRVEFLSEQLDSIGRELSGVERQLRRQQESSGVLDALVVGKAEIEGVGLMRRTLIEAEVEEGAINQLLAQVEAGTVKPRQLGAYPTFATGTALTPLMTQLAELETARIRLLERRTEKDPEVLALEQSIRMIEDQFLGATRSYASVIGRQRAELSTRIDSLQKRLLSLPAAAETGGRLQRDVMRLTQVYAGVQAQLVQGRLATIGEGGLVRQLDFAESPRKPSFPEPWLTFGLGAFGGLVLGVLFALITGWFGRWLRDPREIERATGLSAQRLAPDTPLVVAGNAPRTVLVVPIERGAPSGVVAQRLLASASHQGGNATFLDLSNPLTPTVNGNGLAVGPMIDQLESQYSMVVVHLPGLATDATLAALRNNRPVLLVAPAGRVSRARLEAAVQMLQRLQVPCAGVVIGDAPGTRVPA